MKKKQKLYWVPADPRRIQAQFHVSYGSNPQGKTCRSPHALAVEVCHEGGKENGCKCKESAVEKIWQRIGLRFSIPPRYFERVHLGGS